MTKTITIKNTILKMFLVLFAALLVACSGAAEPAAEPLPADTAVPLTEVPLTEVPPTEVSPTETALPATDTHEAEIALEAGDPQRGQEIFLSGGAYENYNASSACISCHTLDGRVGAQDGPSLLGVGTRAAERVSGLAADDYLRESIMNPPSFIVPTYSNKMSKMGAKFLSEQEVEDVVAFLLTLTGGVVPEVDTTADEPLLEGEIDLGMVIEEGNSTRGRIAGSTFRCTGCHADEELVGYGPPFASTADLPPIMTRGEMRIADPAYEGEATSNQEYIVESIYFPETYAAQGEWLDVMPYNYHQFVKEADLANIMAWLATFE
jgi:mono/diheme cytochrome c family protein